MVKTATPPPRPSDKTVTPDLPLPHESDVSGAYTDGEPRAVVQQAKADLDRGLVDTDLRGAAGVDDTQRRKLLTREGTPVTGGKQ